MAFCSLCGKKLGIMDPSLPIKNKRYCRTHWVQISSNLKNPDKVDIKNIDSPGSMIMASEILSDFDLKKLTEKYVIITDISTNIENVKFNDLLNAINKLSKYGWSCINISSNFVPIKSGAIYFYALLENSDK